MYFQTLTHLRTANPAYGVYFIRHSENNDQYAAIAILKEDQRTNFNKQTQVRLFIHPQKPPNNNNSNNLVRKIGKMLTKVCFFAKLLLLLLLSLLVVYIS